MTDQRKAEAMRLRLEKKLSHEDIAKILGIERSTVSGWLRNVGLSSRAPQYQEFRRIYEDPRDLTGQFCGDPMPGRSALCQRRNG